MARSTLFGYTVEEDEGKIVITLTGSIAETLLQKYTADGLGQDPRLLSSLVPFGFLSSRPVMLGPRHQVRKTEPAPETLDIKEIFGQGFDRSHTEFESQLAQYRDLLGTAPPPAAAVKSAAAPTRKRSRRKK